MDVLEVLSKLGPFLGGCGLIISSVVVMTTFFVVHRRQVRDAWLRDFQMQYGQFWSEDVTAEVRKWIIVDESYQKIEPILKKRNSSKKCILNEEEYDTLEKIDQFCSVIVRFRSFGEALIKSLQRQPWRRAMLAEYWIAQIAEREEMRIYITNSSPQFFEALMGPRGPISC